jgi:hypothetical protein
MEQSQKLGICCPVSLQTPKDLEVPPDAMAHEQSNCSRVVQVT